MKRFVTKLCYACLTVSAMFAALFALNKHFFIADSYIMEMPVKLQLVKSVNQPRTIIVGGSNVAFGIDSQMIANDLNTNVVNAGLHASLGMKYILGSISHYCKQGDKMVIMLEYDHFFGKLAEGEHVIGWAPYFEDYFTLSDFCTYPQMTSLVKGFVKQTTMILIDGLINTIRGGSNKGDNFTYSKSGFNSFGDEESHWYRESPDIVIKPQELGNINLESVEFLADYVSTQRAKGVEVVILPPAVYNDMIDNNREKLLTLNELLNEHGCSYDAPISMFGYGRDCMFDTVYHLNRKGVTVNTNNILSIISAI